MNVEAKSAGHECCFYDSETADAKITNLCIKTSYIPNWLNIQKPFRNFKSYIIETFQIILCME